MHHTRETVQSVGQICSKVAVTGPNFKLAQNSLSLVGFVLTVMIATLQIRGGTGFMNCHSACDGHMNK